MSSPALTCPHCSARLRIRERKWIGQQVGCPHCHAPILIEADGRRGIRIRKVEPQPAPSWTAQSIAWNWVLSPVVIGWTVAGLSAAILLTVALVFSRDRESTSEAAKKENAASQKSEQGQRKLDPPAPVDSRADDGSTQTSNDAPEDDVANVERDEVATEPALAFPPILFAEDPVGVAQDVESNRIPADLPADSVDDWEPIPPARSPAEIAAALQQPIRRYDLIQPTPLRTVLDEMEEMVGVPIRWNEDTDRSSAVWEQPVKARMQNTTVGDILDELLGQVGLNREIQPGQIVVQLIEE